MSGKKPRKPDSGSESSGEEDEGVEEDDKPTLLSFPALKPPRVAKPAAVPKASPVTAPVPTPAAVAPSGTSAAAAAAAVAATGGELYTWAKAIELGKSQLEELYGKASADNPLPFQIRNIFGDILCPTKDGQDFYLPAEQINLDNVKAYYESIVSRLSASELSGKAVKSWYMSCTKRGLVKCFQETMPLMQQEIKTVLELVNREAEFARRAAVSMAVAVSTDAADALGSKRKSGSVSAANGEESKRHREEKDEGDAPTRTPAQVFTSVSDFRRSYYSRVPVVSAKANHHDLSDGYDITALVAASQGAADVSASRKIEVSTYRNRALPF